MQTKNINQDLQQAAQTGTSSSTSSSTPSSGAAFVGSSQQQNAYHLVAGMRSAKSTLAPGTARPAPAARNNFESSPYRPVPPPKPVHVPPPYREPPRPPASTVAPRPSTAPPPGKEFPTSALPGATDHGHVPSGTTIVPGSGSHVRRPAPQLTLEAPPTDSDSTSPRIPSLSHGFRLPRFRGNSAPSAGTANRIQAWVEEQKSTSSRLHGAEKFGSFQQRLRSLLTNSSPESIAKKSADSLAQKVAGDDIQGGGNEGVESEGLLGNAGLMIQDPASSREGFDNPALSTSTSDLVSDAPRTPCGEASTGGLDSQEVPPTPSQEPAPPSTMHDSPSEDLPLEADRTVQSGYALPREIAAVDEGVNTLHLRDACNKLFAREPQKLYWSSYLINRNCGPNMSHNIKSTYEYDKVTPKEVIGKSCQEKRVAAESAPTCSVSSGCDAYLYHATSEHARQQQQQQSDQDAGRPKTYAYESPYRSIREITRYQDGVAPSSSADPHECPNPPTPKYSLAEETNAKMVSDSVISSAPAMGAAGTAAKGHKEVHRDGDTASDQYKSSSESGRGTMKSGLLGNKGLLTNSGPSGASVHDTSVDSDQSVSGVVWRQKHRASTLPSSSRSTQQDWAQVMHEELNQILESSAKLSSSRSRLMDLAKDTGCSADGTCSDSLSVTPPLPPITPPPDSPSLDSPKMSPRIMHHTSLSVAPCKSGAAGLHVSGIGASDVHLRVEGSRGGSKKSGPRRTPSINAHGSYRHWDSRPKSGSSSRSPYHVGRSGHLGLSVGPAIHMPRSRTSAKASIYGGINYGEMGCADGDVTSTTTGLDLESLLDEPDDETSTDDCSTSDEVTAIRKQLHGLETMYSELLRLLGVKAPGPWKSGALSGDSLRPTRRRVHGSLSSLTGKSSGGNRLNSREKRSCHGERSKSKSRSTSGNNKRLRRLESHVVTLARSVAHLSSEMRTQHMLIQEVESLRHDIAWAHDQLNALAAGPSHIGGRVGRAQHQKKEWDKFRLEVLELFNPGRVQKLTKFFGDEPPLLRQFLKKLGYEKYAPNFEAEKIGIVELPYLTEERLQKIGLPMGPRMRILQEAQLSFRQDQLNIYIV